MKRLRCILEIWCCISHGFVHSAMGVDQFLRETIQNEEEVLVLEPEDKRAGKGDGKESVQWLSHVLNRHIGWSSGEEVCPVHNIAGWHAGNKIKQRGDFLKTKEKRTGFTIVLRSGLVLDVREESQRVVFTRISRAFCKRIGSLCYKFGCYDVEAALVGKEALVKIPVCKNSSGVWQFCEECCTVRVEGPDDPSKIRCRFIQLSKHDYGGESGKPYSLMSVVIE